MSFIGKVTDGITIGACAGSLAAVIGAIDVGAKGGLVLTPIAGPAAPVIGAAVGGGVVIAAALVGGLVKTTR